MCWQRRFNDQTQLSVHFFSISKAWISILTCWNVFPRFETVVFLFEGTSFVWDLSVVSNVCMWSMICQILCSNLPLSTSWNHWYHNFSKNMWKLLSVSHQVPSVGQIDVSTGMIGHHYKLHNESFATGWNKCFGNCWSSWTQSFSVSIYVS
jgi:hypothetical protein